MKQFAYFLPAFLVAGVAMSAQSVFAADATFTCQNEECNLSSGDALFNVDNLNPGASLVRELAVSNERDDICELFIAVEGESEQTHALANRLFAAIRHEDGDVYGVSDGNIAGDDKSLADAFGEEAISLGNVAAGTEKIFSWVMTFDRDAGNEFQGTQVSFAADVSATCVEPEVLGASTTSNTSDESNAAETDDPPPPGGGKVAGASTGIGSVLAQTGVWKQRVLYIGISTGLLLIALSIYDWTSSHKTFSGSPRSIRYRNSGR